MIREILNDEIKNAMKSKDKDRLYVFKMIKAEFSKFETSKGYTEESFTEAKEISILQKMHKTWKEECDSFKMAGRDVSELENRLNILESILPEKVSNEKIKEVIVNSGIQIEMKNMGKFLKLVQEKYPTVTGKEVSEVIKTHLVGQ